MTASSLDLLLYNGVVHTCASPPGRPAGRGADAVGVRRGRIAAVGAFEELQHAAGASTRRIDLGGRTLVPGFNDAHAHVWKIGHLRTTMVDLRGAHSLADITERVRRADLALPEGAWLLARGFNEALLAERRMPRREDLDAAVPRRPVVLTRTCGHISAVNSRALDLAGVGPGTTNPTGGVIERDDDGRPTGVLRETATGLISRVVPTASPGELEAMIDAALKHQLALGITTTSDCGVSPELLQVYVDLDRRNGLASRVNVMPLRRLDGVTEPVPLPARTVTDRLRVDTVKFLADGGLSGATAALSVPYRHAGGRGVLRFDADDLLALCQAAHDAGWRIATHAIGDVAIAQVLDIYERLGPHPSGLAHRIEHCGLPEGEHLRRAAALGVIAVPQTVFLHALGRNFREYLPEAFLERCYPVRAMIDAGVRVALSSDAPVVEDDNPLLGMSAAVTRRDDGGTPIAPGEAISAEEALWAYTMGGALATGDERNRGSIEAGKWADFAVLSADPLKTRPELLQDVSVSMTILGGDVVFER